MSACLQPFFVDGEIPVPCGKCPPCLKRRASAWSFRLMQEEKKSKSAYFITLTYDTDHVPITPKGFMALDKRDVQLFYKKLRKSHVRHVAEGDGLYGLSIKYFIVGEYGSRTLRPHYHAILFNAKLELIQPAWDKGEIHYGEVTGASVGYCLKYMMKPGKIPMHQNDDRVPEFQLMSKGLGKSYLTPAMIRWHNADVKNRTYIVIEDGKKISMPRYFKERIYSDVDREEIAIYYQKKHFQLMDEEIKKYVDKWGENWGPFKQEFDKDQFRKMFSSSLKNRYV